MQVASLDRADGAALAFTHTKEPVGFVCVGMDGSVFLQRHPSIYLSPRRRRHLARVPPPLLFSSSHASSTSLTRAGRENGRHFGLERLSPPAFLPLLRDSACSAERRARNAVLRSCSLSARGWLSSIPFPSSSASSTAAQILAALGEESCREEAKIVASLTWQAAVAYQIAHGAAEGKAAGGRKEFDKRGGVDIAVGNAITSAIEVVNAGFAIIPGDGGEPAR